MEKIQPAAQQPAGRAQAQGAKGVHKGAAEKQSKAKSGKGVSRDLGDRSIIRPANNSVQLAAGFLQIRFFFDNIKGKVVESINPVQVCGPAVNPFGFGHGMAVGRIDGDDQRGGDGEHVHF